jgi:hypothetical protein
MMGELQGSALTTRGTPVDRVVVHDWDTQELVTITTPAPNGTWLVNAPPGRYCVSYFADWCAPVCHGPYLVE